jgi:cAMP-dependent protein kinase regulator
MNPEHLDKAQSYIRNNVAGILEKLTVDLLEERPERTVEFMIDWLAKHGEDAHKEALRKIKHRPMGVETSESEDEDEEEDEEEFHRIIESKRATIKNQRKSISAEAYGHYNPKGNFQPKVVEKDSPTRKKIEDLLSNSFLFKHLEQKEMSIIVNAMEIRNYEAGTTVIKQGEDGFELYIVGNGQLRCTKRFPEKNEDTFLKNYEAGEYFGELALLYNVPRAASITATTSATLYSLDRECFNHIVKDSAMRNRNIYEQFLSEVDILNSLDNYERSKLCDCLKIQIFEEGQRVIREGEKGNSFYLIIDGEATALKVNPATGKEESVMEYRPRMYFGELALLRDEPRAASIIAKVS